MYRLVIAEKPSVAMSIAKVLGATARKEGHMEGCGSPVATSKRQGRLEAPTEPTGETGWLVSWCIGIWQGWLSLLSTTPTMTSGCGKICLPHGVWPKISCWRLSTSPEGCWIVPPETLPDGGTSEKSYPSH